MENGSKIRLHGILVGHVEHPSRRRVGELPQKTGVRPGGEDVSRQKMQIRCRESAYVPEVQATIGLRSCFVTAETENRERSENAGRTRTQDQINKVWGKRAGSRLAGAGEFRPANGERDVRPGRSDEGPGGSDAGTPGPQGSAEKNYFKDQRETKKTGPGRR